MGRIIGGGGAPPGATPEPSPGWWGWILGAGDGGALAVAGTTTFTAGSLMYEEVEIEQGGILDLNGYPLVAKGDVIIAGTLYSGVPATRNSTGQNPPIGAREFYGIRAAGGGTGGMTVGNSSNPDLPTAQVWIGGQGGAGGAGAAGAGGTAAAMNGAAFGISPVTILSGFPHRAGVSRTLYGGGLGGGGGGDGSVAGGGSGSNGGLVVIVARRIVVAATGLINCKGGTGGTRGAGNVGGGGGGGGGVVVLVAPEIVLDGTVDVSGGAPGNGVGTGANGLPGNPGLVLQWKELA